MYTCARASVCFSDGHGAGEDAVLEHHAEHQEQEVEHEHGEAEAAAHPPAAGRDGDDDEEEHEEEQHDGAEEAVGAHLDGLVAVRQRVHKPGDGQAGKRTTTNGVTFMDTVVHVHYSHLHHECLHTFTFWSFSRSFYPK